MVLVVVMFFVLMMAAALVVLQRRTILDSQVVKHRDHAREAESMARGGLRIAETLILEDMRSKLLEPGPSTLHDDWFRVGAAPLIDEGPRTLVVEVEDLGGRFPLNAIVNAEPDGDQWLAWRDIFAAVIEEMPGRPEEKLYDPEELVEALVDWVDEDDLDPTGNAEARRYDRSEPLRQPPNRPLLSIDELRLVEGFDGRLVDALRAYVSVYPLRANWNLNLNTAPPWVLTKIQLKEPTNSRPVTDDWARDLLNTRRESLICAEKAGECFSPSELGIETGDDVVDPPHRDKAEVFRVRARARVGAVQRTLEVVIDASNGPALTRLAWKMR
jgi:type II secretory pathway component PulK